MPALCPTIPVILATLAAGQPAAQAPPWSQRFQQVDPGFTDRDPLAVTQRTINFTDLREPSGFANLYRLPGADGSDVYARRSGAVTALFPRSVYGADRWGRPTTEIPPGTVFILGEPSPQTLEQFGIRPDSATPRARSFNAVNLSAAQSAQAPAQPVRPPRADAGPVQAPTRGIFLDERYRQRRVTDLIAAAARAAER